MRTSKHSYLITWDFTLAEQGMVARYGRMGGRYYRQFLPGGIEAEDRHPPKNISGEVYEFAKRANLARLG